MDSQATRLTEREPTQQVVLKVILVIWGLDLMKGNNNNKMTLLESRRRRKKFKEKTRIKVIIGIWIEIEQLSTEMTSPVENLDTNINENTIRTIVTGMNIRIVKVV